MFLTFLYYLALTGAYLLFNPSSSLQEFLLPWVLLQLAILTDFSLMKNRSKTGQANKTDTFPDI